MDKCRLQQRHQKINMDGRKKARNVRQEKVGFKP